MPIEAPIESGWNPDGFAGPAKGRYHVQVVNADEDGGTKSEMIIDFEVLAGTTPGQEGLRHREYFQKTVKAMSRIHTLAIALGMVTSDQIKDAQAKGASLTYDFESQVGKQLCISLSEEEYNGKTRCKVNFEMYHVANPKVADWPKNAGMLKSGGYDVPAPAAKPAGPGAAPINLAGIV